MNKQITLILTLALISVVSAFTMYPGETIIVSQDLGTDNLNWLIVDNTSAITVLPEVNFNLAHIKIYLPGNMPPNSFTLVFIENQTKNIIIEVPVNSGSGGGTKTVYKDNIIYVDRNNTLYKNNTIYLDKSCNENIFGLNQTNQTIDNLITKQEHLNWLQRFWRWFKGIFH
jgi:hypothetical protein